MKQRRPPPPGRRGRVSNQESSPRQQEEGGEGRGRKGCGEGKQYVKPHELPKLGVTRKMCQSRPLLQLQKWEQSRKTALGSVH